MEPEPPEGLNVEAISPDVTVVRFSDELDLSGQQARTASDELMALINGPPGRQLLLDFGNVRSLTSMMIGKLVVLHRAAESHGQRLALFNLRPKIHTLLEVTRLTELLSIYADEQQALDGK